MFKRNLIILKTSHPSSPYHQFKDNWVNIIGINLAPNTPNISNTYSSKLVESYHIQIRAT